MIMEGCCRIVCLILTNYCMTDVDVLPLLGEEEELEVEQEEEQKGPDLKLASRRDMYSICQSVGLG